MGKQQKLIVSWLIAVVLLSPVSTLANTVELDRAVSTYYAGRPAEAIEIITPLAESGNADAQYLLGNILFSLSQSGHINATDEAVIWYQKAASNGRAEANRALGTHYYNRWITSRHKGDARLAIDYYQKAMAQGIKVEPKPLNRLGKLSGVKIEASPIAAKKPDQPARTIKAQPVIAQIIVETDVEPEVVVADQVVEKPEVVVEQPEAVIESVEPVITEQKAERQSDTVTRLTEVINDAGEDALPQRERRLPTLSLNELAEECNNYTPAGFVIYADSIQGAPVSGTALVRQVVNSSILRMTVKQTLMSVRIDLQGVPQNQLRSLKSGDDFELEATIVHAQLKGSECRLSLQNKRE